MAAPLAKSQFAFELPNLSYVDASLEEPNLRYMPRPVAAPQPPQQQPRPAERDEGRQRPPEPRNNPRDRERDPNR